VVNSSHRILDMEFPQRLSAIRKEKGLTQQKLAKLVGLHVAQVRRYEGGTSQPTLEVIRKLAVALSVSADTLLFDKDERGPDNDLRLQFEAISRFEPEEKQIKRLIKHPSPDHRCRDRRVLADWGAVLGNHLHLLHTGFFQRDSEDICKAPGRWPWRFRSG
jgi:transcriptional regulator with XRE-family HTH domain